MPRTAAWFPARARGHPGGVEIKRLQPRDGETRGRAERDSAGGIGQVPVEAPRPHQRGATGRANASDSPPIRQLAAVRRGNDSPVLLLSKSVTSWSAVWLFRSLRM